MRRFTALTILALAVAGCGGRDENAETRFSGDFCELTPRRADFAQGEETIVDKLKDDDVLVAVNGYPLTKRVFDELMALKRRQIAGKKGGNEAYVNNQLADFRRNYVSAFVNQRLLIDAAHRLKVMTREEIEDKVNEGVRKKAEARKMSVADFVKSFPGDFKYYLYESEAMLLMGAMVKEHIPPVAVVDDGLVAEFQKAIDADNAAAAASNEMKRARMEGWKKDVLEGRATFAELAKRYNEDEEADEEQPELWGTFERGEFDDKRVQAAVFALEPGEISDPVEDDDGYHLLKVVDVQLPEVNEKGRMTRDETRTVEHIYVQKEQMAIRDANDILKADLHRQMQIQAINDYLENLKTNAETRIDFPHGKKLFE